MNRVIKNKTQESFVYTRVFLNDKTIVGKISTYSACGRRNTFGCIWIILLPLSQNILANVTLRICANCSATKSLRIYTEFPFNKSRVVNVISFFHDQNDAWCTLSYQVWRDVADTRNHRNICRCDVFLKTVQILNSGRWGPTVHHPPVSRPCLR